METNLSRSSRVHGIDFDWKNKSRNECKLRCLSNEHVRRVLWNETKSRLEEMSSISSVGSAVRDMSSARHTRVVQGDVEFEVVERHVLGKGRGQKRAKPDQVLCIGSGKFWGSLVSLNNILHPVKVTTTSQHFLEQISPLISSSSLQASLLSSLSPLPYCKPSSKSQVASI